MNARTDILIVDPFMGGSHQAWAKGYAEHSKFRVELMGMSAHHWKWRMHGGAVSLAEKFKSLPEKPRLIVASSMLDVAAFKGLSSTADIPIALYFHENQLTYPWSATDPDQALGRDRHYAFINYTSALAADRVYFNSDFHQSAFLKALPTFLSAFPDHEGLGNVRRIADKSSVLHLGMELQKFGEHQKLSRKLNRDDKVLHLIERGFKKVSQLTEQPRPVVLWNHRWEQDKGPDRFLKLLQRLKANDCPFWLLLLGQHFNKKPAALQTIQAEFTAQILHSGFVELATDYHLMLSLADFYPVTTAQDFFGLSVVEAMYAGAHPLLPVDLAYQEHFPKDFDSNQVFYASEQELLEKSLEFFRAWNPTSASTPSPDSELAGVGHLRAHFERYDWNIQAPLYDQCFGEMMAVK